MRERKRIDKLEREHSPKHDGHKKDVDANEETVIGKDAIRFRPAVSELDVLSMKRGAFGIPAYDQIEHRTLWKQSRPMSRDWS